MSKETTSKYWNEYISSIIGTSQSKKKSGQSNEEFSKELMRHFSKKGWI
jgi:hypothetical protein